MNTLIVFFVCLVAYASAIPSGLWGYGHGHLPLVGASGVVSSGGVAGPSGIVTGHGAIGPNGLANAVGHVGLWGHSGVWGAHDDGQWHGEGLLASQDWAGHGVHGVGLGYGLGHGLGHGTVIAGPAGTIVAHGVHGAVGIGHGHW